MQRNPSVKKLVMQHIREVIESLGVAAARPIELVDMSCLRLETIEPSSHLVMAPQHFVEAAPPLVQIPQGLLRRKVLLVTRRSRKW
jgi:hypothetical protein